MKPVPQESFSLYVHIPYCLRKCPYCDFNSIEVMVAPEREYLAALVSELRAYHHKKPWLGKKVASVFIGGGTPSLLTPLTVSRLIQKIDELFGMTHQVEITLEANPVTGEYEKFQGFFQAGVNRLSLGAQSFDDGILARLGRLHSSHDTLEALNHAAKAGFTNLSIDLIFGVPTQSLTQWKTDLLQCVQLNPAHVATYELTIEPGTHFYTLNKQGLLPKRQDEELADMYTLARDVLASNSYNHYEISNFARPGKESTHNLTYWRRQPYLGIGAGAHSFDPEQGWGRRWSNELDPASYIRLANKSGAVISKSEDLGREQAISEFLFLGLRLLEGVDQRHFEQQFHLPLAEAVPQLHRLTEDGLFVARGSKVAFTPRGRLLADSVLATIA